MKGRSLDVPNPSTDDLDPSIDILKPSTQVKQIKISL